MPQSSDEPSADLRGGRTAVQRARARRFVVPLAIAVAGIALALASEDTVRIIGWGIFSVAAVIAVSLVFLEIGYSEDRDREREQQARRDG